MRYYLGLDNGGTVTKAALFDSRGREIGVSSASTQVLTPRPGWAERDMEEMWQTNCRVIRQVLERTGVPGDAVAAVAVCGHGKGLYLWGRDGRPARAGILSADSRAQAYTERWHASGAAGALYPHICQTLIPCQPPALLAWILDHEPEVAANTRWIFGCKDYIRFRLTGRAGAEYTDRSGTGLMDLIRRDYDAGILDALGIAPFAAALPPLCDPAAPCGEVTAEAAALTGLKAGTPVAGGMFDIDACALALGLTAPGQVCMIAGTWSINVFLSPTPAIDGQAALNSLYCLPEYYLVEESSPTSAGNNEWFINTLLPEARAGAEAQGERIYDRVSRWVASLPPEEDCPVFLPFLMGGPLHADSRGHLAGLTLAHTRAHIARSIYEGVVFSHKWHFERLRRANAGRPDWSAIRLAGGAARSPVWAQMFADILELPVEAAAVHQAGGLGCAMAAAVAAGDYASLREASAAMAPPTLRYLPDPAAAPAYRAKYRAYLRVLDACGGSWSREAP